MFAIAFDLKVADTIAAHPSGQAPPAYAEIRNLLDAFGFSWIQGSVYVCESEDLANLYRAITALKQLAWFRRRCATSAPSGSNNGATSLPW